MLIPPNITNLIRWQEPSNDLKNLEVSHKLWYTDSSIGNRVDPIQDGYNTIILILMNDANLQFYRQGLRDAFSHLPVGSIVRFDPRHKYAMIPYNQEVKEGDRFAFLSWNIPDYISTGRAISEFKDNLAELDRIVAPRPRYEDIDFSKLPYTT